MAVPFVTCRHEVTGATADIPETALLHLPAYMPVEEADRKRLGYDDPTSADPGDSAQAGDAEPTSKSKPATGAAKQKEK